MLMSHLGHPLRNLLDFVPKKLTMALSDWLQVQNMGTISLYMYVSWFSVIDRSHQLTQRLATP